MRGNSEIISWISNTFFEGQLRPSETPFVKREVAYIRVDVLLDSKERRKEMKKLAQRRKKEFGEDISLDKLKFVRAVKTASASSRGAGRGGSGGRGRGGPGFKT